MAVVLVIIGFEHSSNLAAAYGIAVTGTFVATSCLALVVFHRQFKWNLGLVLLVVCALVVILALAVDSLALLLVASVCGGVGQGLSFMTGMRAMTSRVAPEERTAVTTSYFIVGYLALAVPAMLAGFLTVPMGLVGSTTVFSVRPSTA